MFAGGNMSFRGAIWESFELTCQNILTKLGGEIQSDLMKILFWNGWFNTVQPPYGIWACLKKKWNSIFVSKVKSTRSRCFLVSTWFRHHPHLRSSFYVPFVWIVVLLQPLVGRIHGALVATMQSWFDFGPNSNPVLDFMAFSFCQTWIGEISRDVMFYFKRYQFVWRKSPFRNFRAETLVPLKHLSYIGSFPKHPSLRRYSFSRNYGSMENGCIWER